MYNINDLNWTSDSNEMESVSFERFVLCSCENIEGLWSAVKWANDGEGLLVGSSRGMVALFDVNEGRGEPTLLWQAKHLKMAITSIEWLSQYQYVTAGNDKTSRVWDIREVGHFVYENFEYLSWGVVAAPLDEYRYALCTHEGEVRVVFPVSKNEKKPASRNSKTRSILQVPGALSTIVTRQISPEFDELEHVCYCGGSSGIVYRVTIPERAHRAKRRRVTADEVARFEVDEDSSERRSIRISLRTLVSPENEVDLTLQRSRGGRSLLLDYPQELEIRRMKLSMDGSLLAATTNAGFILLMRIATEWQTTNASSGEKTRKKAKPVFFGPKKKRGRPRKYPRKDPEDEPIVKRKRGRPRKYPVPPPREPRPKRKRGRPRKP